MVFSPTHSHEHVIPRLDLLSERNLYLASIGHCSWLVIGTGIAERLTMALRRTRVRSDRHDHRFAAPRRVPVLATTARNALYHDAVLLWSDVIHKSPDKARPRNNLGHAYAQQGKSDLAMENSASQLTLQPDYPLTQESSASAYLRHVKPN